MPDPMEKLVALLLSLYSAEELRWLVRHRWPAALAELPGALASPRSVAEAVVDLLERKGLLDAEFFDVLREDRPRRAADIDGVAALCRVAPHATMVAAGPTARQPHADYPYDIFLAHAGADAPIAATLYRDLAAHPAGLSVFFDAASLELGQAWDLAIPAALRQSRLIVVLVSPNLEAAFYARVEIAEAIQQSRHPESAQRVVPVFLERRPGPDDRVPYGLTLLQGVCVGEVGMSGVVSQLTMLALKLRGSRAH